MGRLIGIVSIISAICLGMLLFGYAAIELNNTRQQSTQSIDATIKASGLVVVQGDYIAGSGWFGEKPIYVRLYSADQFVKMAKDNNVSTVYHGKLYHSGIFSNAYWFPLDDRIVAIADF